MAKYISSHNPIYAHTLKRKETGSIVIRHGGREDVRFTRIHGGWLREHTDFSGRSPEVVSSAAVAKECNGAVGCKSSWARVY